MINHKEIEHSSREKLSTSERKRKEAGKKAGRQQQIKNVRGNKSILKHRIFTSDRSKLSKGVLFGCILYKWRIYAYNVNIQEMTESNN